MNKAWLIAGLALGVILFFTFGPGGALLTAVGILLAGFIATLATAEDDGR